MIWNRNDFLENNTMPHLLVSHSGLCNTEFQSESDFPVCWLFSTSDKPWFRNSINNYLINTFDTNLISLNKQQYSSNKSLSFFLLNVHTISKLTSSISSKFSMDRSASVVSVDYTTTFQSRWHFFWNTRSLGQTVNELGSLERWFCASRLLNVSRRLRFFRMSFELIFWDILKGKCLKIFYIGVFNGNPVVPFNMRKTLRGRGKSCKLSHSPQRVFRSISLAFTVEPNALTIWHIRPFILQVLCCTNWKTQDGSIDFLQTR